MKLTITEILIDSPYAFVNEEDFSKRITYPCQLLLSVERKKFPVQGYLTKKYVAKGEIGLSSNE